MTLVNDVGPSYSLQWDNVEIIHVSPQKKYVVDSTSTLQEKENIQPIIISNILKK